MSKKTIEPTKIIKKPRLRCPDPSVVIINSSTPYFDPSEFSTPQKLNAIDTFNSTATNKKFLHTIRWEPKRRCCQVLKARIIVKMRSNSIGRSITSSDAGNDNIALVKNGGTSIVSERIYSGHTFSFPVGTNATKKFTLTGSQLDWLNAAHKLSIYIQDDTAVKSIKVKLWVCCLDEIKRGDTDSEETGNDEM